MTRIDFGALVGAACLFAGPICPYGYVGIHKWSLFEISQNAAWMIIILSAVIVGLVVLKQTLHVMWCGILAVVILKNASWFPFIRAYADQSGEFSSMGAGWGIFPLYGGTALAIIAGGLAMMSALKARQSMPSGD